MKNRPPKEELEAYSVAYDKDSVFASHARLLQSKWRQNHGYPTNDPNGNYGYGNYLEIEYAKSTKANYLSNEIKSLVSDKIIEIRKKGGLIGEPRIWDNLLSSQPLCFNLFGLPALEPDLATEYFQKLFPGKIDKVSKIDFEFSSKRNNPDNSAFDVFVEYYKEEKKRFIGIEVKYQENLKEETPKKAKEIYDAHQDAYTKLTNECNVFKMNVIEKLRSVPLSQIWRDHLLTFNMKQDYDDGFFVFLYPFENEECATGVADYQNLLVSANEEETRFYPRNLADFIWTLRRIHETDITRELVERYLGV